MRSEVNNSISRFAGKHFAGKQKSEKTLFPENRKAKTTGGTHDINIKNIFMNQVVCLSVSWAVIRPNIPKTIFKILQMPCLFVCFCWRIAYCHFDSELSERTRLISLYWFIQTKEYVLK
jgi:hypothetical protein